MTTPAFNSLVAIGVDDRRTELQQGATVLRHERALAAPARAGAPQVRRGNGTALVGPASAVAASQKPEFEAR
jgi:hypothetical protein